ncbi:MAG: DUF3592 domain-containing protein [Planctomycetaceae bacterium]
MFEFAERLVFKIAFTLTAIYLAYALRLAWRRGKASMQWPATEGTIVESKVEYDGDRHLPKIRYHYQINSEILEGNTSLTGD